MAGTHQRVGVVRDAGKLCVHRQLSCKDKNDASKDCTEGGFSQGHRLAMKLHYVHPSVKEIS
jgi:hypothetical protein